MSGSASGGAASSHRFCPTRHLPGDEAVGPSEITEADGVGVDEVQFGEGLDHGTTDPASHVGVVLPSRRGPRPR